MIRACAAFLLMFPGLAAAEPVIVRSGEHATFTRLVFDFAGRETAELSAVPGGYQIEVNGWRDGYDLSQVFRYIPRTRLREIERVPGSAALFLRLGCDCAVQTFYSDGTKLVVDIQDPKIEPKRIRPPKRSVNAMFDGPVQLVQGTDVDELPPLGLTSQAPPAFSGTLPLLTEPLAPVVNTDGLTNAFAQELARAAAQGLIDPTDVLVGDTADRLPVANINIESAVDRALGRADQDGIPSAFPGACRSPRHFAVSDWADSDTPLATQIGTLRLALLDGQDRPNEAAVRALARLYIYMSFGAEARQLVDKYALDGDDAQVLAALGDLMDLSAEASTVLTSQIECDGPGALWAVLSLGYLPDDLAVDRRQILLAYTTLPAHLRRHFGPRLSQIFADAGDTDGVSTIGAAVERVSRANDPDLILSRAFDPMEAEANERALQSLARGGNPDEAEALALVIERLLAGGETVPEPFIENAAILAFERFGSPSSQRLKSLEIRSRLANGEVELAIQTFAAAEEEDALPPGEGAVLSGQATRALIEKAVDAEFLQLSLDPYSDGLFRRVDPALARMVSRRLLTLGFPDRAAAVSPPGALGDDDADNAYAAELALVKGDTGTALRLTQRARTTDALRVRARALSAAGRHAEAAQAFARLEKTDESVAESWRASDWTRLMDVSEDARGEVATAVLDLREVEPVPEPPSLAESQTLLDESADLRRVLGDLLNTLPPPAQ